MKLCLLLLLTAWSAQAHHILVISSAPSRSHNNLGKGIVDALLNGGHQITWATAFPETVKPAKNLKTLDISATRKVLNDMDMKYPGRGSSISVVKEFSRNISTIASQTPALRDAVINQQFDAVVTEWFFSDIDSAYAAIQKVPWILLSGMSSNPYVEYLTDEVRSVSTIPMWKPYPVPMTFLQRLENLFFFAVSTVTTQIDHYYMDQLYHSLFDSIAEKRGVVLPPFREAMFNISILLMNSHPSISPAKSVPPNVIDIAGYHIDEKIPPLPKDLQEILDGSPQGVVYFSMGSVVKAEAVPLQTRRELTQVFSKLPYTVLWKFDEELETKPKNVHIRSWMPQPSILAHPNVKLFISHGGLLSTLEAISAGIPLLAVPVFGDQPSNADRATRAGYARTVPFAPDMAPAIAENLKEMMENDQYYKTAKHLSKLFVNRPTSPAHLINHYVELAIETKGAAHLRSKTYDYPFYQRIFLDQIVLLALVLYVIIKVIKRVLRLFRSEPQKKSDKKKKNN